MHDTSRPQRNLTSRSNSLIARLQEIGMGPIERRRTAGKFLWHAKAWFAGESPLYERLSQAIAKDAALLNIARRSRPGQPIPYIFFGAVKLLLARSPGDPLAAIYEAAANGRPLSGDPFAEFRRFCLEHKDEVLPIISERTVQSNIVSRAAALVAAQLEVTRRLDGEPFWHIEIGASAGLTMLSPLYSYEFGERQTGPQDSAVRIKTQLRGDRLPPLDMPFPQPVAILGNELEPLDISDDSAMDWLEALIWPEREYHRQLHRAAVEIARRNPPRVVGGDALKALPALLEETPVGSAVTVYHSHTLNQFTEQMRQDLETLLIAESSKRRLFRIAFEGTAEGRMSAIELFDYRDGERTGQLLAYCHPHGNWMEWLAD